MNTICRRGTILVAIACIQAPEAPAQADTVRQRPPAGAIDGVVADSSLAPLSATTVSVIGSNIRVVTGADGRFRLIRLPPGQYMLLARRIGYESATARVDLAAGDTLRVSLLLEPVATSLDTVVVATSSVSPKIAEFLARRKAGEGEFMTQDEIDRRNSESVLDLLAGFKSLLIVETGILSRRSGTMRCSVGVLVDGLPARAITGLPSPKEIAGIEVYSGPATIPLRYKRTADGAWCGLVLLWTRDGSS
jgi:hypothetical protein